MNIITHFADGILPDQYGKHAGEQDKYKGRPIRSFPFTIKNAPADCRYFCFTLIDHDAVPVCGFSWIHWLVANVPASFTDIPDNFSQEHIGEKVQGMNSCRSLIVNETDPKLTSHYTGPTPPDKDHLYTLTVYALKEKVDVREGFYLNELYTKMEGLVIEKTSIKLLGRS